MSTYQGTIDWGKVKASGRAFAITRVGDGLGGDNTFDTNWAGIKAAGMMRGAYQFFRASDDPMQQADILLAKIGTPADGDLPPTLDLEVTRRAVGERHRHQGQAVAGARQGQDRAQRR